jgi:short-subunit dehydrogenase
MWQINYFSLVAMCKAFLPLLAKCPKSRIVNLSSMAGRSHHKTKSHK